MRRSGAVLLSVARGVARLELASPATGNRIDESLAGELRAAAERIAADDSVCAVLIAARGPDFCVGGLRLNSTGRDFGHLRVADAIARIPQPVVVALQGAVHGQGLELALAGDIRIAAPGARFAMHQLVEGGMPFDGGTQRLPRLAGRGMATDMMFTGRQLAADEALSAGIVSEVVPGTRLVARAYEIVVEIARRGATAGRFAKEAMLRGAEMPLDDGLRLEADLNLLLFHDAERAEGLAAFNERRGPRFDR